MANSWAVKPHQTVPDKLAQTLRQLRESKDRRFAPALARAREREWCVPALAVAAGMQPGAVAQRIQRARQAREAGDLRGWNLRGIQIPTAPTRAIPPPANAQRGPEISEAAAEHLRELHSMHRRVRGSMPLNHPNRQASRHLAVDINRLIRNGTKMFQVVEVLPVSYRAVHQILERHALKTPPPSIRRRYGTAFGKPGDGRFTRCRALW